MPASFIRMYIRPRFICALQLEVAFAITSEQILSRLFQLLSPEIQHARKIEDFLGIGKELARRIDQLAGSCGIIHQMIVVGRQVGPFAGVV